MTKQPRSWWPAEGETRLSKRHDKVAMGGEQLVGPYDEESCGVVSMDSAQADVCGCRACRIGAKVMEGAKTLEVQHPETRRRMGSGTARQSITEQERSVSAPAGMVVGCQLAASGKSEPYKSTHEVGERRAEVGGGHKVAMTARTTEPARAKGLQPGVHPSGDGCGLASRGHLPAPERDQAQGPPRMLGSVANAVAGRNAAGRLPGGEPCDREGHARFWEGVLETESVVYGDGLSPCVGNPRSRQPGLKTRGPRQRPTPHRIWRSDVLQEAWRRVRSNRGAAGVDRETLADVEEYGVERMLQDLQDALRAGRYRPLPVRRRDIPKPDGGVRPLGIPTVRDRVVQQAAKLVLEPIFEADFLPTSYGYRPKRSATEALECIRKSFIKGCTWVLELDIRSYFDSIDEGVRPEGCQAGSQVARSGCDGGRRSPEDGHGDATGRGDFAAARQHLPAHLG